MAASGESARKTLDRILDGSGSGEIAERLRRRPPSELPLGPRLPATNDATEKGWRQRTKFLKDNGIDVEQLARPEPGDALPDLEANIENFVGFSRIPVGVLGPLRINGAYAHGDFYVPLATTEGALIASYNRGAYLASQSGGVSVLCLTEKVTRAPCFLFDGISQVGLFLSWILPRFDELKKIVAETSRFCRLVDLETSIVGKEVFLIFEYSTGDAAGQNMVTFATDAACRWVVENCPTKPRTWYLEGNMSGDKKATGLSFSSARGKKVVAETTIDRKLIQKFNHTDPEEMVRYWEISVIGGIQSNSIGVQGHVANALAALFIACGQDVACVSEASVGLTRLDVTDDGDLYASISLPNLIVGTVGGGTHLPTARECLEMLDCYGNGKATKFAEICAATALAGEISIIGALAAGDFGSAHARHGRKS